MGLWHGLKFPEKEETKAEKPAAGKPTAGFEEGSSDCLSVNLGLQLDHLSRQGGVA
jgi:hypothetical protein